MKHLEYIQKKFYLGEELKKLLKAPHQQFVIGKI